MKHQFNLDDFVDLLLKAKKAITVYDSYETSIKDLERQKESLQTALHDIQATRQQETAAFQADQTKRKKVLEDWERMVAEKHATVEYEWESRKQQAEHAFTTTTQRMEAELAMKREQLGELTTKIAEVQAKFESVDSALRKAKDAAAKMAALT